MAYENLCNLQASPFLRRACRTVPRKFLVAFGITLSNAKIKKTIKIPAICEIMVVNGRTLSKRSRSIYAEVSSSASAAVERRSRCGAMGKCHSFNHGQGSKDGTLRQRDSQAAAASHVSRNRAQKIAVRAMLSSPCCCCPPSSPSPVAAMHQNAVQP